MKTVKYERNSAIKKLFEKMKALGYTTEFIFDLIKNVFGVKQGAAETIVYYEIEKEVEA